MRITTRPRRTGLIVALTAAACIAVAVPQYVAAEPTSEDERANLTHEEIALLDSGDPVDVVYDATTGVLISVDPAAR